MAVTRQQVQDLFDNYNNSNFTVAREFVDYVFAIPGPSGGTFDGDVQINGKLTMNDTTPALTNTPDIIIQSVNNQRLRYKDLTTLNQWYVQVKSTAGGNGLNNYSIGVNSNPDSAFSSWSTAGVQNHTGIAATTGAITNYTWQAPANTGQTATTDIQGYIFQGGNRQWLTGAIPTQREFIFGPGSYSAVAATVMSDAFGTFFQPPSAGTNMTITRVWAIGVNGNAKINGNTLIGNAAATNQKQVRIGQGSSFMDIGESQADFIALWLNQATPSTTNYFVQADTFDTLLNANYSMQLKFNNTTFLSLTNQSIQQAASFVTWTKPAITAQTASTERRSFTNTPGTTQWNTGALAAQRDFLYNSPTYSAVAASVFTNVYTALWNPPLAGTNMTITTPWAGAFNGNLGVGTNLMVGSITSLPAAFLGIAAGTTAKAQINFAASTAPTSPVNGDFWFDGTNFLARVGGVTKTFTIA